MITNLRMELFEALIFTAAAVTPSGITKCWRVAAGLCLHISPVGGALLGSSAAAALVVTLVTAEPVPVKHRSS